MSDEPIHLFSPIGALFIGISVAIVTGFAIRMWFCGSNDRKATFFRAGLRVFPLLAYVAGIANECASASSYIGNAPLFDVQAYVFTEVSELLAVTRVMPGLIVVATVGLLTEALVGRIERWRMQGETVVPSD